MRLRTVIVIIAAAGLTAVVAGCGSTARQATAVRVVAGENVYGDIVRQIGGSHVDVSSILSDPTADPHLYEPGTRTGLAVAKAKLVIENGLGYDAFLSKLEHAAPSSGRHRLVIGDVLGLHGRDANPHLWYDVPRLGQIGNAIAAELSSVDPAHKAAYRAGARRFVRSLVPLQREVADIRARAAGAPVAYTEPVPGYLLSAAGLVNRAPTSFTRAIEDGTEPPPQAVAAMFALVHDRRIHALLYNSQAVSPLTARVRDAAARAKVPVVPVTETLPPHMSFQHWQLAQARALARALLG